MTEVRRKYCFFLAIESTFPHSNINPIASVIDQFDDQKTCKYSPILKCMMRHCEKSNYTFRTNIIDLKTFKSKSMKKKILLYVKTIFQWLTYIIYQFPKHFTLSFIATSKIDLYFSAFIFKSVIFRKSKYTNI